jgi:hypothetical protein
VWTTELGLVLVMTLETLIITAVDGTAVLCQTDGCGKPALYVFSGTARNPSCST